MDAMPLGNQVALITGANSGVGKETAVGLAALGATTVLACRDAGKAAAAVADVRGRTGNQAVDAVRVDLRDLESVERCGTETLGRHGSVDILVNNAGGYWDRRAVTAQGFEQHFGVNYLSHYVLTRRLLETQGGRAPRRIVSVTSLGHRAVRGMKWEDLQLEQGWTVSGAYGQSKLAQILFTRELARRFGDRGVIAHAAHPGSVRSGFGADGDTHGLNRFVVHAIISITGVSPATAARTSIHLASSEAAGLANGAYWARRKQRVPSKAARDADAARSLWAVSEDLVVQAGLSL